MARHHGAFGDDPFGRFAEKTARFFGTPQYIIGQTLVVAAWIVANSFAWAGRFDGRPYILLNLIFSTQAAYAAPLILLAQTRQADRDKDHTEMVERRHTALEETADTQTREIIQLLNANTALTSEVHALLTAQREAT
ncbi:MAG TPA: DUF1003 domain-containing protein [Gaiellaceae bacterium]